MANGHEHADFLLQSLSLCLLLDARCLAEDLDSIARASGFLDAEVDLGKVSLSELLQ
jgi:hypothetical protein